MKKLLILIAILFAITGTTFAQGKKVIIVLQENGGSRFLVSWITDAQTRDDANRVIDALAETFENFKVKLQANGRYDKVINLTDANCTRVKLLQNLKAETDNGNIIDLLILGHGSDETLVLKNGTLTGTAAGNIRSMKTEFANRNFNLRLVYMCNCKGGSTADDWLAIGANTVVACPKNNYMPEPQTTWFFDDFLLKNKSVSNAANDSYNASKPFYTVIPRYQSERDEGQNLIDCSKPRVYGETNLRFNVQSLAVGESKVVTIQANVTHNLANIYMRAGERYKFTVSGADKWKNGGTETTANGYQAGFLDGARRQPAYNMMTLVGEIFRENNGVSYQNNHFKIGTSRNYTAEVTGFLICHGNDNIAFYGDNTGSVNLTVERLSN